MNLTQTVLSAPDPLREALSAYQAQMQSGYAKRDRLRQFYLDEQKMRADAAKALADQEKEARQQARDEQMYQLSLDANNRANISTVKGLTDNSYFTGDVMGGVLGPNDGETITPRNEDGSPATGAVVFDAPTIQGTLSRLNPNAVGESLRMPPKFVADLIQSQGEGYEQAQENWKQTEAHRVAKEEREQEKDANKGPQVVDGQIWDPQQRRFVPAPGFVRSRGKDGDGGAWSADDQRVLTAYQMTFTDPTTGLISPTAPPFPVFAANPRQFIGPGAGARRAGASAGAEKPTNPLDALKAKEAYDDYRSRLPHGQAVSFEAFLADPAKALNAAYAYVPPAEKPGWLARMWGGITGGDAPGAPASLPSPAPPAPPATAQGAPGPVYRNAAGERITWNGSAWVPVP